MEPAEGSRDELTHRLRFPVAASSSLSLSQEYRQLPQSPHYASPSGVAFRGFSLGMGAGLDGNGVTVVGNNSSSNNGNFATDSAGNVASTASNRRPAGIPPFHPHVPPPSPHSQITNPASRPPGQASQPSSLRSLGHGASHARSLSQPAAFFSLDSLPPLSPSPYWESPSVAALSDSFSLDVSMENRDVDSQATTPPAGPFSRSVSFRTGDGIPPRKAHRRSHSEVPFGFFQSPVTMVVPPPLSQRPQGFLDLSVSARVDAGSAGKQVEEQSVKKERVWDRDGGRVTEGMRRQSEGDGDDPFKAYLTFDRLDALNPSRNEHKHDNFDSRANVTRTIGTESSENEDECSVNESGSSLQQLKADGGSSTVERREGNKRSASGDPSSNINFSRHSRSLSMDSFTGKMNFADESPELIASSGVKSGQPPPTNSLDGTSNAFGLEFGNGEFSGAELKKIMANERLAEIALTDPKRAKRILANRQSAARSKERKMKYISELEHKVQTLQTEATTLSAQLTLLQRDSAGLASQNNELNFRLQAMEQQAQLRDALNEALTAEVQHLKIANRELAKANPSSNLTQLHPMNLRLIPLREQQTQQQNRQEQETSLATEQEAANQ